MSDYNPLANLTPEEDDLLDRAVIESLYIRLQRGLKREVKKMSDNLGLTQNDGVIQMLIFAIRLMNNPKVVKYAREHKVSHLEAVETLID